LSLNTALEGDDQQSTHSNSDGLRPDANWRFRDLSDARSEKEVEHRKRKKKLKSGAFVYSVKERGLQNRGES